MLVPFVFLPVKSNLCWTSSTSSPLCQTKSEQLVNAADWKSDLLTLLWPWKTRLCINVSCVDMPVRPPAVLFLAAEDLLGHKSAGLISSMWSEQKLFFYWLTFCLDSWGLKTAFFTKPFLLKTLSSLVLLFICFAFLCLFYLLLTIALRFYLNLKC